MKFLDYVEGRFCQSMKASTKTGEILVMEVNLSILPKFDIEAEMQAHIDSLKF